MGRLLLIDDEQDVRYSFERIFAPEQEFATASSGEEGLGLLSSFKPDLVIMDLRMGEGIDGLETLRRIRKLDPKQLVILMTAYGTTQTAIEAMKLGAYDYVLKPFDVPRLKELVARALKAARDMREVVSCEPAGITEGDHEIVGRSEPMQQVFKLIGQLAASDATALITGESGTGKELVARAIYHHSKRARQPFLAVNCAAIPEPLLESELFGHERGSFTGATTQRIGKFEQCHHGTIFLDEIGDMTPATQTKILRVLQSGTFERVGGSQPITVNVRLIAATNRHLEQAVASRQFREDLFYRLNVVRIHLPPLRDRREDVPLLVNYLLRSLAREQRLESRPISSAAVKALRKYHWPGNVRELENVIRRALVVAKGPSILLEDLPPEITGDPERLHLPGQHVAAPASEHGIAGMVKALFEWARRDPSLKVLPAVEKELVIQALRETNGNQVHAARLLGITRATLRKRTEKFGISKELRIQ
jgi:nitrogen regulation protein NR(I)